MEISTIHTQAERLLNQPIRVSGFIGNKHLRKNIQWWIATQPDLSGIGASSITLLPDTSHKINREKLREQAAKNNLAQQARIEAIYARLTASDPDSATVESVRSYWAELKYGGSRTGLDALAKLGILEELYEAAHVGSWENEYPYLCVSDLDPNFELHVPCIHAGDLKYYRGFVSGRLVQHSEDQPGLTDLTEMCVFDDNYSYHVSSSPTHLTRCDTIAPELHNILDLINNFEQYSQKLVAIGGVLEYIGDDYFILPSFVYSYLNDPRDFSIHLPKGNLPREFMLCVNLGGTYDGLYEVSIIGRVTTSSDKRYPLALTDLQQLCIKYWNMPYILYEWKL